MECKYIIISISTSRGLEVRCDVKRYAITSKSTSLCQKCIASETRQTEVVQVWSPSVVPKCGPQAWSPNVVPKRGPQTWSWSSNAVPKCGPQMWSIKCGPQMRSTKFENLVPQNWSPKFGSPNLVPNVVPQMRSPKFGPKSWSPTCGPHWSPSVIPKYAPSNLVPKFGPPNVVPHIWSQSVFPKCGPQMWSPSVIPKWSPNVVPKSPSVFPNYGPQVCSPSVFPKCGPQVCSPSVVPKCGPQVWSPCVVPKCPKFAKWFSPTPTSLCKLIYNKNVNTKIKKIESIDIYIFFFIDSIYYFDKYSYVLYVLHCTAAVFCNLLGTLDIMPSLFPSWYGSGYTAMLLHSSFV